MCRQPLRSGRIPLLNEVLSLNAQEFRADEFAASHVTILNEVLSLNAQEFVTLFGLVTR